MSEVPTVNAQNPDAVADPTVPVGDIPALQDVAEKPELVQAKRTPSPCRFVMYKYIFKEKKVSVPALILKADAKTEKVSLHVYALANNEDFVIHNVEHGSQINEWSWPRMV